MYFLSFSCIHVRFCIAWIKVLTVWVRPIIQVQYLLKYINAFSQSDIRTSDLYNNMSDGNIEITELVDQYNITLAKTRTVIIRPNSTWYNENIREEKHKRRQLENKWRRSKLEIDRQLFCDRWQLVISLMWKAKKTYYSDMITESSTDQKQIFNTVNRLLHKGKDSALPKSSSDVLLGKIFSEYFVQKFQNYSQFVSYRRRLRFPYDSHK